MAETGSTAVSDAVERRAGYSRIIGVVLLLGLTAWVSGRVKNALRPESGAAVSGLARQVQLRGGVTRDLATAPGKLLLVHFWATWCPPCVEELPGLVAYARQARGRKDLELLAVSVDEYWNVVEPWLAAHGAADLPVALDAGRKTAHAFGTEKFPETYVLSPEGAVLLHVAGPMDWGSAEVRARIEDLAKR